jgi:hypothetical protein
MAAVGFLYGIDREEADRVDAELINAVIRHLIPPVHKMIAH